jgi:hypothetical protein
VNPVIDDHAPDEISMRSPLYRAENFFGMEPFLARLFICVAIIMVIVFQQQLSIVIAVVIFTIGIPWLRSRGKHDIQWSSVLIRATVLQPYYPPTSYINVKPPRFRKQQRIKRAP